MADRFNLQDEAYFDSMWHSIRSELNRKLTRRFQVKTKISASKKSQDKENTIPVIQLD